MTTQFTAPKLIITVRYIYVKNGQMGRRCGMLLVSYTDSMSERLRGSANRLAETTLWKHRARNHTYCLWSFTWGGPLREIHVSLIRWPLHYEWLLKIDGLSHHCHNCFFSFKKVVIFWSRYSWKTLTLIISSSCCLSWCSSEMPKLWLQSRLIRLFGSIYSALFMVRIFEAREIFQWPLLNFYPKPENCFIEAMTSKTGIAISIPHSQCWMFTNGVFPIFINRAKLSHLHVLPFQPCN